MAQPTPYARSYSFTDFSSGSPSSQPPGTQIDAELDAVGETLADTLRNLALLQRDDGALRNGSVGVDQLHATALALVGSGGFRVRGQWSAAEDYAAGDIFSSASVVYLVVEAHVSTALETDLAAGRVVSIFDAASVALQTQLALATGAGQIGSTGGITVQAALNLKASASSLALATGLASIGSTGGITAQAALDAKMATALLASASGAAQVGFQRTDDPTAAYLQKISLSGLLAARPISIREYLLPTEAIDTVNAFDLLNRATGADLDYSGNDSDLNRAIVIDYPLVFPAEDRSVFVRRGQRLIYTCNKAMDLSALVGNTKPVFRLARKSDGTLDPGGLPVEIWGLRTVGGPGNHAVFDSANCTSPMFRSCFLTSAGIGIDLGAGSADGIVLGCYFDQGLTGLIAQGQNHIIDACGAYDIWTAFRVTGGAYDIVFGTIIAEYIKTCGLLVDAASCNVSIGTYHGVLNEQFPTFEGFIQIAAHGAKVNAGLLSFRNPKGPAIYHGTGVGATLDVAKLVVDGLKTNPLYAQSTTAAAFSDVGLAATFGSVTIRNCTGTPFTRSGAVPGSLAIGSGRFSSNTGGAADIVSADPNPTSFIDLHGVRSDRALVTESSAAKVRAFNCIDSGNVASPVTVASAAALPVPHVGNFLYVTGATNITSIAASYAGREITIIFGGVLTVTDGGNLFLNGNLVTAVNTTLTLVTDGTNWHEKSRSANG